jgi:hypothetical protein
MKFKMFWKSTGEPVRYEDPSKHFRFIGTRASCQLEAQVEVPSFGFSWKADPLNTSESDFAVIGEKSTAATTIVERPNKQRLAVFDANASADAGSDGTRAQAPP